jgi:hypothetical protein
MTKATIGLALTRSILRTAQFVTDLAGWYPTSLPERRFALHEVDKRAGS